MDKTDVAFFLKGVKIFNTDGFGWQPITQEKI